MEASALMSSVARIAGVCWVGAAISFWLAWFLMPLPGTTDAGFILAEVGATSGRVFWSVAFQLISSALFAPALLGLVSVSPRRGAGLGFAAASLVGVGVTGLAADAIYHLVAYEMSLPGVTRDAMLPVMERFQSADRLRRAAAPGALGRGGLARLERRARGRRIALGSASTRARARRRARGGRGAARRRRRGAARARAQRARALLALARRAGQRSLAR